jgi:hypothetical protein
MLLMQTTVLVGADRVVMVRLPHALPPGRHHLTVLIDQPAFARAGEPEVGDVIGYDYDAAQAAAYDAVYHN